MSPEDFQTELDKQSQDKQAQDSEQAQLDAVKNSGTQITSAVNAGADKTTAALKNVKGEVKVTNTDFAKSQDVDKAVEAINKLNLTTFMSNEGLPQLAKNLSDLSGKTQDLQDKLENEGLNKMSDQLSAVVKKLDEVSKTISKTEVSVDAKLQKTIDNLSKSINAIDFKPEVNVTAPDTKVITTPVELKPVIEALGKVENAVKTTVIPDNKTDLVPVIQGLADVQKAINSLRFPVPNYVLPFRNQAGKDDQVQLSPTGGIPVTNPDGTTISSGTILNQSYDYLTVAYPNGTTEVYTYKVGGASGTTIATVTMVYTDSTKAAISTITKT